MDKAELQAYLETLTFELEVLDITSEFLNVEIPAKQLHDFMAHLKDDAQTRFDYLFCLTGVDWGEDLGVIYHLESTAFRHQLTVRTRVSDRESPEIDSVWDLWYTAEFHEREAYDFFGIVFKNHPNLKRLFLTDEWPGFPLRKDYVDEVNMIIK